MSLTQLERVKTELKYRRYGLKKVVAKLEISRSSISNLKKSKFGFQTARDYGLESVKG